MAAWRESEVKGLKGLGLGVYGSWFSQPAGLRLRAALASG